MISPFEVTIETRFSIYEFVVLLHLVAYGCTKILKTLVFARKIINYMRYGNYSLRPFKCDESEFCSFSRLEMRAERRQKPVKKTTMVRDGIG